MKKAIYKLCVGLVILSLLLTGCVVAPVTPSDTTKETGAASGTSAATSTEAPAATEAAVQTKPVKIMYTERRESNQEDVDNTKKFIEEQSGVKFETKLIKVAADFETAVSLSLASNEDIDVILVQSEGHFFSLEERGALKVITEPLKKYGTNLLERYDEESWKAVTNKQGDILGIPRQGAPYGTLIVARKNWREKLNMGPITTIEEFEEYLRALKDTDFDGNGKKDTIPLIASWSGYGAFEQTLLYCFTETNPEGNYIDPDGKVTPVYMHPKYKDFLATLAKWHKEGLIFQDMLSVTGEQVNDLQVSNRVGALAEWWSDYIRPYEKLLETVPDAEYEFITPKTVNGNKYRINIGSIYSPRAGFVSYSENTEFALKLFDWMLASIDNYWTTKQGIQGVNWRWVNKEARQSEKLKGIEKAEEGYNYQFSFLFYTPWDGRLANPGFVDRNYYKDQDWQVIYNAYIGYPDWFVKYDFKGTPAESNAEDARTLIAENTARIILGEKPIDEWDDVIAQYREIYGDAYIELATKQYNEYVK